MNEKAQFVDRKSTFAETGSKSDVTNHQTEFYAAGFEAD